MVKRRIGRIYKKIKSIVLVALKNETKPFTATVVKDRIKYIGYAELKNSYTYYAFTATSGGFRGLGAMAPCPVLLITPKGPRV